MQIGMDVLFYMVGFGVLLLFLRFFHKPLRIVLRLVISTLTGGLLLMLLNSLGGTVGISVAVNPVTALIAGALGLPGIAALLFIKLWL